MYAKHFGLSASPFGLWPSRDPLMTAIHREALATIIVGIAERRPLTVLVGDIGVGKTTILQHALRQIDASATQILEIGFPLLSPDELVAVIARALGLNCVTTSSIFSFEAIDRALRGPVEDRDCLTLVIDEAQKLPLATLEALRLLLNLPAAHEGRLTVILVGQPELWTVLSSPELRPLRDRVSLHARVRPLSRTASTAYIEHRLQLAGGSLGRVMTKSAARLIARVSVGVPRRINNLADNALITAFGRQAPRATAKHVREAVRALDGVQDSRMRPNSLWLWGGLSAAGFAVFAAMLVSHDRQPATGSPGSIASAALVAAANPMPTQVDDVDGSAASAAPSAARMAAPPPPDQKSEAANAETEAPSPGQAGAEEEEGGKPLQPSGSGSKEDQHDHSVENAAIRVRVLPGDSVYGVLRRYNLLLNSAILTEFSRLNPNIADIQHIKAGGHILVPVPYAPSKHVVE